MLVEDADAMKRVEKARPTGPGRRPCDAIELVRRFGRGLIEGPPARVGAGRNHAPFRGPDRHSLTAPVLVLAVRLEGRPRLGEEPPNACLRRRPVTL